jgi:ABC-2 type transport system ATP-binding protein
LYKAYGKVKAVNNVSFAIKPGEIFGLLGPNGAGKTTTIKCCVGLLRPTQGDVTANRHCIVRAPEKAKALLGYVPDNPFLYEKLSGREMVGFVAQLFGVSAASVREKVDAYFRLFEMQDDCDRLIQGYSRGMRQKVAMIAALLHQPRLLIADEPTANLDPKSARLVKDLFLSLRSQGRSVLLSTHIMEIAELLCDRVAIIYQGEIRAIGTLAELRERHGGDSLEAIFLEVTHGQEPHTRELLQHLTSDSGGSRA